MRLLKLLLILFVCCVVGACGETAAERVTAYNAALDAYKKGDYSTALRLWRPLAEQGATNAQYWLGVIYHNGQGVPKDYAAAVSWYRKAAAQGNAYAQNNLGVMYVEGRGVPQDDASAAFWYRKAAEQDQAAAQNNLGAMYVNGQGVPKDYAAAAFWYRKAAAQGTDDEARALAQKNLQELLNWIATSSAAVPQQSSTAGSAIPMKREGGTYIVPVLINNAITLDFTVDSGASDVTIPEDVVSTLIRTGTIRDTDFIGEQIYTLADGSKVKSKTFRIRSLKVGDRLLENVTGSVASTKGSLLLGQSFLGRFKSWSIDNSRHVLLLE